MSKITTVNQLQTSVTRIAGNLSTALNTVAESLEEIENLKADKTVATTSADGFISASDKTKLDNLTAVADTDTFLTKTDAASTYVTKDGSKVLSANDFTTAEKTKLRDIESSAQVNVIETVKVNNSALTPSNKAVNIDLSNYVTKDGSKVLSTNDFTTALKTKLEGIGTGNTSTAGLTKLYTGTGTNTDGTMTQSALKTALDGKLGTSENAASASKLNTPRSLKVSLNSNATPTFDGSANCTVIGVGGALPIANGGTGQTTAAAARNALGLGNTTGALPIANGGTGNTIGAAQQFVSLTAGADNAYRNVWFGVNGASLKPAYDADFQYNPSTNILNVQNINGTSITISGGLTSSGTIKGAAVSVSGGLLGASVSVSGGVNAVGTLTGAAASLGTGGVITTGTVKGAAVSVSGGVNAVGSVTGAGLSVTGGLLGSSVSVSSDISAVNINATNLNVTNLVLSSTESEVDNCLWIEWS